MRARVGPEVIRFRAPVGFASTVRAAAKRDGLTLSEFIRRLALDAAGSPLKDREPKHMAADSPKLLAA